MRSGHHERVDWLGDYNDPWSATQSYKLTHLLIFLSAAHASSPATAKALLKEMSHSLPPLLNRFTRSIPDAFPKAYRFEGEMREISDFVCEQLGPGESKIHEGISSVYARIAKAVNESDNDEVAALQEFVEGGKRASST